MSTPIQYSVDLSTNPATWPGPDQASGYINISKVDVIFLNTNGDSDFHTLRTGTNEHIHHALKQVTKHVACGLYRIVSLNMSEYSCVVVISTEKQRSELLWKNGFPWDIEGDLQPEIAPLTMSTPIQYSVDLSTNPATSPDPNQASGYINISKVDVIFLNINGDSDFHTLRTGTNEHIHHVLKQVTKHVACGLYRIVSLNMSEYSCVVVISTEKKRSELLWKNGFPWDIEGDLQPEIVLK